MIRRSNIIAAMALLFAFAAPAFAESERMTEGSVTVFMKTGATAIMHVTDKAMLDDITRGAVQLDDHAMLVMHDGKLFLVADHKMANGKLISEALMGHN
jgi:hypothetical protein